MGRRGPQELRGATVECLGVGTRGEGSGHRIGTGTRAMGRVQGNIVGYKRKRVHESRGSVTKTIELIGRRMMYTDRQIDG